MGPDLGFWLTEKREAARLAGAALLRGLRAGLSRLALLRLWFGTIPAPALLLVPQDLRTVDPVRGDELIGGVFVFAGRIVAEEDPFAAAPPNDDWAEALASFVWLRHLRAAGTPEAAAAGRRLVLCWLEAQRRGGRHGTGPAATAERIRAWIGASGLLLAGADQVFYRRFSRALWRQVRLLDMARPGLPPGPERLAALIALVTAGLCLEGEERLVARASRELAVELDRQILPDGCHVGRNPGIVVGLVLDLLPLRQLFHARNLVPPAAIFTSVDRMMPMIRFFQLGDGSLARFNGMGSTAIDQVATALVYDETRGMPPVSAPHGGYERIEAGGAVVVMDVGAPPPAPHAFEAHAGCLAFEFSAGREVMVINCGAPQLQRETWRGEARKTAAHSTVTVAERSSARFGRGALARGALIGGPGRIVKARRPAFVEASHDGYAARLGILHARSLRVSATGGLLEGVDAVTGGDAPYVIRFHLHPAVEVVPTENPNAVLLRLPGGEGWRFSAGQPVTVEESVALAAAEGPRRTMQLAVTVASSAEVPEVAWSFARLEQPRRPPPADPAPELPL